jgi:hypothetical protein
VHVPITSSPSRKRHLISATEKEAPAGGPESKQSRLPQKKKKTPGPNQKAVSLQRSCVTAGHYEPMQLKTSSAALQAQENRRFYSARSFWLPRC